MRIRPALGPKQPGVPGNAFVLVDDLENHLGKCWIEEYHLAQQLPERPLEVRLCYEALSPALDDSGRRQLLGTAFARAMLLVSQRKENARIYAECRASDTQQLELLTGIGLVNDEMIVSMKREMDGSVKAVTPPKGCILVCDRLADEKERRFFIDRQKKVFGRANADEWLEEILAERGMKRMMLINDSGLVGELVCWVENGCGVIGMVYTAPAWRRMGAASYLMESARHYFWQHRVMECRIEVRSRMTPMLRLAASIGYSREKILKRLPGTNIDAAPAVKKPTGAKKRPAAPRKAPRPETR